MPLRHRPLDTRFLCAFGGMGFGRSGGSFSCDVGFVFRHPAWNWTVWLGGLDTGFMSSLVDRQDYAELSTSNVAERDAFAYWRDMICATFVRLNASPVTDTRFTGRIEHVPAGELELSTVEADSQRVRRTHSLITRSDDEYLLASIQVHGCGYVEQDDRSAALSPGEMAFYDSSRPYTLHFAAAFRQLVVQLPKRALGVGDTTGLTARPLGKNEPGGVAAAFFTSFQQAMKANPRQSGCLVPHAVSVLSAAASFADSTRPSADGADALLRERVLGFLRRHYADPRLDGETVAAACGMSRRNLYRILGDGGFAARLRSFRITRAKEMLVECPGLPVGRVGRACGFDSESGFHRAFRAAAGHTPGQYRRLYSLGTRGQ